MSDHKVVLPIRNDGSGPLTVVIEPWSITKVLGPGGETFVVAKGPAGGDLEVQRSDKEVIVHGWEGSQVAFSTNDPTKQSLAEWFVEQMRTPHDPKAAAAAEAFEAQKADVLHAYFVRKGQKPATARTRAEMEFVANVEPCPKCGARGLRDTKLTGSGQAWTLSGACTNCPTTRSFKFATEGDPSSITHGTDELSPRASFLITADQFRAELERVLPQSQSDSFARHRALVCVNELLKLEYPAKRDALRAELQALVAKFS